MKTEKKGLFGCLAGGKKEKSCCCSFELEEINDKNEEQESKINAQKSQTECCSCGPNCCVPEQPKKKIMIDFLYLDLSVCERCQGTDKSLDEALQEVSKVLKATGAEAIVNKINVINKELAIKYKFKSSPTIRVNGNDIQMDIKESLCESCGDLCHDTVDCRVWMFEGKEYLVPPKALIIEAILKAVYGSAAEIKEEAYELPENLKRFYDSMKAKGSI